MHQSHDETARQLLLLYLDELPARVGAIHQAIRTGDEHALTLAAHTLRSTSALVGASDLATLCSELEAAVRKGTAASMAGWLRPLDEESSRVRAILGTRLVAEASA